MPPEDLPETPSPEPTDEPADAAPPAPKHRRRWPWITLASVLALLIAGAITGYLVYQDGMRARDALQVAASALPQVAEQIRNDPEQADASIATVQEAAHVAAEATAGFHWTIAGWLPWIGDNTRAMQTITSAVDRIATEVLPQLPAVVHTVTPDRLAPKDGKLNLAPLLEVRDGVVAADRVVGQAFTDVSAIPRGNLIAQLADATDRLQAELAEARELTSAASSAVQLLPAMLGADGPRNWLLLAQNNAELRSTGGIPGAAILLHADAGKLGIVKQRSSGDFGPYKQPILPLTDDELRLFGVHLGLFLQDVNLTPDFPRTGELVRAMWAEADGGDVQNVLSLDPVALQTMLRATGPVEFTDPNGAKITLTSENTASFLMSEVYAKYGSPEVQDAVFALAARAVLKQLMSGDADAGALLGAFTEVVDRGRLLVWSANPAEQALLEAAGVSGALRGSIAADEAVAPVVGVFLNLTTASKMGYYLDTTAEVSPATTNPDGRQEFDVRVRITSTLKPGQAEHLPAHVIEGNALDGTNRLNLFVYAPTEGTITPGTDQPAGFVSQHNGLGVAAQTVTIAPAKTEELTFHIVSGPDQTAEPRLRITPGARNT